MHINKGTYCKEIPDEAFARFKQIYENGSGLNICSRVLKIENPQWSFSEARIRKESMIRGYVLRKPRRKIQDVGTFRR